MLLPSIVSFVLLSYLDIYCGIEMIKVLIVVVSPTSVGGSIHFDLVAICSAPTIHFNQQGLFSSLIQTSTHSSICFSPRPLSASLSSFDCQRHALMTALSSEHIHANVHYFLKVSHLLNKQQHQVLNSFCVWRKNYPVEYCAVSYCGISCASLEICCIIMCFISLCANLS